MNSMLTTIVAGAFVLGVVVLVHEFGHFIVAKMSGIFVKTFSIGFGKKVLRKKWGDTEYALSVLPFGGYVKFAGESVYYDEVEASPEDEAGEDEDSDEVPDRDIPREKYFTTKRPLIRAAVLFAGPFMNYVLAVFLYIGVFAVQGVQVIPTTQIGEVTSGGAADSVGLAVGDVILAIDGTPVNNWSDVEKPFLEDAFSAKLFRVDRDGVESDVEFRARSEEDRIRLGFGPHRPAHIGRVQKNKPAHNAGLRSGAVIEAINDTTVTTYDQVRRIINAHPDQALYIRWSQDGVVHADSIVPDAKSVLESPETSEFKTVGVIGIGPQYVRVRESLGASIVGGFNTANNVIVQIISYLGKLFTGKMGVKTLGGPILITQMAGDVANWGFDYLLLFLAFFNINLCIFNLLPLLPFDGGHLTLLAYEGIMGKPVNRRVREWLTQGGFILIILLMAFVLMLDLSRCSGAVSSPF